MDGAVIFSLVHGDPMLVEEGAASYLPRRISDAILAGVPAHDKLPPILGVCASHFARLASPRSGQLVPAQGAAHKTVLPPYRTMPVVRVHKLDAPDGAVLAAAIPGVVLRAPAKILCIHSPVGKDKSETTSVLAGDVAVCKMCATRLAFTSWSSRLLDATACAGKYVGLRVLTDADFMIGVKPFPSHNGFGAFRAGAFGQLGAASLLSIASEGLLAPVTYPAPITITNYIRSVFGSDATLISSVVGCTENAGIAMLLELFGAAAEKPCVSLLTPEDIALARLVLEIPGIFQLRESAGIARIEQPGWPELKSWLDDRLETSHARFVSASMHRDSDAADIVAQMRDVPPDDTLVLSVWSPRISARAVLAVVTAHPMTRVEFECWHSLFYLFECPHQV